jgi:hypothetical protein
MALFEEGSLGHVEGNPKIEEALTSVLRLMFFLYDTLLRLCRINMTPCFMKDLSLSIREEWMCNTAQFQPLI